MWRIDKESEHNLESRVGHQEQHSRVSYAEVALGFGSEKLPWLRDDGETELPMVKFRTLDDDGNVEYSGMLHDDDECANQEAALDFAMHDVGCTVIEVMRNGEWIQEIA